MATRVYTSAVAAFVLSAGLIEAQPTPRAMLFSPNDVHGTTITDDGNIYCIRSNDFSVLYQDGESTVPNIIFLLSTPIEIETVIGVHPYQPLAPVFGSDDVLANFFVSGLSPDTVSELVVLDNFGNVRDKVSGMSGTIPSMYINAQFNDIGAVKLSEGATPTYGITSAVFERDDPSASAPASQIYYRSDVNEANSRVDFLDGQISDRTPESVRSTSVIPSVRHTDGFPGLAIASQTFPPNSMNGMFNISEVIHDAATSSDPVVTQTATVPETLTLVGGAIGQVGMRELDSEDDVVVVRSVPLDENLNLALFSTPTTQEILALTSGVVTPATPQECALADFDNNGMVDIDDALFFADCMSENDGACGDADLNGDTRVDYRDFSLFVRCFGQSTTRRSRGNATPMNPGIGLQLLATQVDLDFPGAPGRLYLRTNWLEGNGRGVAAVVVEKLVQGSDPTHDMILFDALGNRVIYNEGDPIASVGTDALRPDNLGLFHSISTINPAGQFGVSVELEDGRAAIFRYQGIGTTACFLEPVQIVGYILQAGTTLQCFDPNNDMVTDVGDIVTLLNQPPIR